MEGYWLRLHSQCHFLLHYSPAVGLYEGVRFQHIKVSGAQLHVIRIRRF